MRRYFNNIAWFTLAWAITLAYGGWTYRRLDPIFSFLFAVSAAILFYEGVIVRVQMTRQIKESKG